MGKGDKKTRRGKICIGTFGRLRPRKKSKINTVAKPKAKTVTKKTATKKTTKKKTEKESE